MEKKEQRFAIFLKKIRQIDDDASSVILTEKHLCEIEIRTILQ